MAGGEPIERYDQLPAELKSKISDLGAPTFVQLMEFCSLGGLATAIVQFLPNQRVDRLAVFVAELARQLSVLAADNAVIESELAAGGAPEKARLLRDASVAAEKAVSDPRAARIARLVASGLAKDELAAQRARTFLSLLESLTDIEMAVLAFMREAPSQRKAAAWRSLSAQLASAPELARIFENDVAFWVACVSKLEAGGLLEGSTVWGGEFEGKRSQEEIDAMMHRVDLYTLTTLGRELVAVVDVTVR